MKTFFSDRTGVCHTDGKGTCEAGQSVATPEPTPGEQLASAAGLRLGPDTEQQKELLRDYTPSGGAIFDG